MADNDQTEDAVRTAFGVAHGIGGAIATAFGAGALVEPIGRFQQQGLDKLFNKVAPSPELNARAREVASGQTQTPPVRQKPSMQVEAMDEKEKEMLSLSTAITGNPDVDMVTVGMVPAGRSQT